MALDQAEVGRRLKTAREACGMTQEEVAAEMQLSRATIAQIELGNRSVSGIELGQFAYLYARDIQEFLAKDFSEEDLVSVLLRSEGDDSDGVRHALRDCISLGHELNRLEAAVGISRSFGAMPSYPSGKLSSKWDAIQNGTQAAGEERRRLGLGSSPVGDIMALLEVQGIRTGVVSMPSGVSGLMISHPKVGLFVVVNSDHPAARQRFSWCHEYAHLLLDRSQLGHVSRETDRASLLEVRANVFAACFLMPEDGVRQFIGGLGKGHASRVQAAIFDEVDAVPVDSRTAGGTQELQLYDAVQLAHHFGVSVLSALYRLRNLRLLSETAFEEIKQLDQDGSSQRVGEILGLPITLPMDHAAEFYRRYLALALEAYRREKISRRKLMELAQRFGVAAESVEHLLDDLGLLKEEAAEVMLPAEAR